MKYFYNILFFLHACFLFPQSEGYYKIYNSSFGTSAISVNTIVAKTYSFTIPVYKVITDPVSGNLFISTRQKEPNSKTYTNKGFHLILKQNDTACCVLEDSKLDLTLIGNELILSNDNKSSRFNRTFGYEQFEYQTKIIYTIAKNNTGLTYDPALKLNSQQGLSCINLSDGSVKWSAPVPYNYDWNAITYLNDSVLIVAAGGLHALNINRGLIWSYPLTTASKSMKPYVFSTFNPGILDKEYSGISLNKEEGQSTGIASNILITDSLIYFASKEKLIAIDKSGQLKWEKILPSGEMSACMLKENRNNILLVNFGVARYHDNIVMCGAPFVSAYNRRSGAVMMQNKMDVPEHLSDIGSAKNSILITGKNKVIEVTEDLKINCVTDLPAIKFGHFLEFVSGDDYFVEKEGFYVPLNFINDNVIYFKTDHGKVFGMNSNNIEYEYHFTELYKLNNKAGNKKLITQNNRSFLLSENFEVLQTFNTGENAIINNDKIYFAEERLLHIVDLKNLK